MGANGLDGRTTSVGSVLRSPESTLTTKQASKHVEALLSRPLLAECAGSWGGGLVEMDDERGGGGSWGM